MVKPFTSKHGTRYIFIKSIFIVYIIRYPGRIIFIKLYVVVCLFHFFVFFFVSVPSPMSLAGVRPLEMHGANFTEFISRSQSYGALSALSRGSYESLSSLEDVHHFLSQSEQAVLSIEELRLQLNSCFT